MGRDVLAAPKTGVKTGVFFGGKNAITALNMLSIAQEALVPPFGISLFADPGGHLRPPLQ